MQKIDAHLTPTLPCRAQCLREASLHRSRRADTKFAGVRFREVHLRWARFHRSSEVNLRKSLDESELFGLSHDQILSRDGFRVEKE